MKRNIKRLISELEWASVSDKIFDIEFSNRVAKKQKDRMKLVAQQK